MSEHDSTLGEEEIQSESTVPEMPAEADTDDTDGTDAGGGGSDADGTDSDSDDTDSDSDDTDA